MKLWSWDIDLFPLKTEAARQTPGQRDADRFLREVQPGDLDRLTREHEADPADRFFGVPTGGGGSLSGDMDQEYPTEGYNRPNRSYEDESGEYGHRPGEERSRGSYHMPGITHPLDDDYDDLGRSEATYHIVTRQPGAQHNDFTEHTHHRMELEGEDYDPDEAGDQWAYMHPQHENDIVHVHPAEHHDIWRNQLASEQANFEKIAPHGFKRESPDVLGHKAYTHTDPNGGIHRLWHNDTTFIDNGTRHGPGWRTSYHDPSISHGRQIPWTFHDDDSLGDSLDDALVRVNRNKIHSDVVHSGTGLKPVENSYGRHYVSTRPDGSTLQMMRNYRDTTPGGEDWGVTHYPQDQSAEPTTTWHGNNLTSALTQAKANRARG